MVIPPRDMGKLFAGQERMLGVGNGDLDHLN